MAIEFFVPAAAHDDHGDPRPALAGRDGQREAVHSDAKVHVSTSTSGGPMASGKSKAALGPDTSVTCIPASVGAAQTARTISSSSTNSTSIVARLPPVSRVLTSDAIEAPGAPGSSIPDGRMYGNERKRYGHNIATMIVRPGPIGRVLSLSPASGPHVVYRLPSILGESDSETPRCAPASSGEHTWTSAIAPSGQPFATRS